MKQIVFTLFMLLGLSHVASAQSDRIKEAMEKKYGADGLAKLSEMMNKELLQAEFEDKYEFDLSMKMRITGYKNGSKSDESYFDYFLNTDKPYFAVKTKDQNKQNREVLVVYDMDKDAMLVLQTAEKSGTAINFNLNKLMSSGLIDENSTKEGKIDCKKSGKTKTISGYPCQEFICVDAESNTRTEVWFTDKIQIDITSRNEGNQWAKMFGTLPDFKGMMIEGYVYKNEQLEGKMEVLSINEKEKTTINTKEYSINGVTGK